MYALVTAASLPSPPPPVPSPTNRSARLIAPITPARGTAQRARSGGAGATISNAASGRPTRLGCAQSTKAIRAKSGRHHDCFVTLRGVTLDVRDQRELPRALDGRRQLPLMTRAHSREPARQNLAALGKEPATRPVILLVEHPRAGFAHGAGVGGTAYASPSFSPSSSGTTAAVTPRFGCSRAASTMR